MKTLPILLLIAALCVSGCQSTSSGPKPSPITNVTVNFQNPEKFTDVREHFNGDTSQYYLDLISQYLKEKATRRLAAGQKLVVTFTNIDLAGDFIPGSRPGQSDIRVIKAIYIPRMTLNFKLLDANGAVIKEGERTLTDLSFQQNISIIDRNEPLFYDKPLLDRWVAQEFGG